MYKSDNKLQSSFLDFNQPMGLYMNPENRWIKMADMIPWDAYYSAIHHTPWLIIMDIKLQIIKSFVKFYWMIRFRLILQEK